MSAHEPDMVSPSVYTIAPDIAFVDALAEGLIARVEGMPEILPTYQILLPTRRACRALQEAFLRQSNGKPLLLPVLTPIGDADEDELTLYGQNIGADPDTGLGEAPAFPGRDRSVQPAISGLRRQVLLARLISADKTQELNPDQAMNLAQDLALVLDQIQTERVALDAIPATFPMTLSAHWERVLKFLNILGDHWPNILAAEGTLDPADRRNQVLGALATLWSEQAPSGPVIAAGSTGSIPATADLLVSIANLDQGEVILPGLDQMMPDDAWASLDQTHPQWGLKQLLSRLSVKRDHVKHWPQTESLQPNASPRSQAIAEVMRCPETTHLWSKTEVDFKKALRGVKSLTATTLREEAGAISVIMRNALEVRGRRCALVTPDRGLARRVAAMMRRWDIRVDDSAGQSLSTTEIGSFFSLIAEAAANGLAPSSLLAVLKHPFCTIGTDRNQHLALTRALELLVLRGPRPRPGVSGLRSVLKSNEETFDFLLKDLAAAFDPLIRDLHRCAALKDMLHAHTRAAEMLSSPDQLWRGESGELMATFLSELAEAVTDQPPMEGRFYGSWLNTVLRRQVVRPTYGTNPRLFIWGPLEARLQAVDIMILGGLNEGTWPINAETGPWMSRPMQAKLGLTLPERRIGLAAHDIQQAMCAPEVWLTRAARVDGSPTVPSRWLVRLNNLLQKSNADITDDHPTHWFKSLVRPKTRALVKAPTPKPPVAARPRQLPVTDIETWIRDPYALYAKRILNLRALDAIDADPGAADRGQIIHYCLEQFIKRYPMELPSDPEKTLVNIGKEAFEAIKDRPAVASFWWPRFLRIAAWFVLEEAKRRSDGWQPILLESTGHLRIEVPAGAFILTAKADRIDSGTQGLAIIDYKTGTLPSVKQVTTGLTPQLTLEAAIAEAGGFEGIKAKAVSSLVYIKLSGARTPGEVRMITGDPSDLAATARENLSHLIQAFDNQERPYIARPRVQWALRYNDYDHLARTQAWEDAT